MNNREAAIAYFREQSAKESSRAVHYRELAKGMVNEKRTMEMTAEAHALKAELYADALEALEAYAAAEQTATVNP